MSMHALLFYFFATVTLLSTIMAVTRRVLVHAVVWMVAALIGTALIFLLLGAPLLAGFEVIIYAGAIMVLFLFVIMLMAQEPDESKLIEGMARWRIARRMFWPAVYGLIGLVACMDLIAFDPSNAPVLQLGRVSPRALGAWVFGNAWPGVEAISLLLLAALAGAHYLGQPLIRSIHPRYQAKGLRHRPNCRPEAEAEDE